MIKRITTVLMLISALGLSGCATMGAAPAELILGEWQTRVGSFPLTITYAETTVQLGGAEPVAYQLDGDRLTYADGGQQVRIVSFPEPSVMQQLDPVTGTAHMFSRVTP